jgi:hypothetical protein
MPQDALFLVAWVFTFKENAMTSLLPIVFGLFFASFSVSGFAQVKVDNDPFKYPVYEGRMTCDDKVFVVVVESLKIPNNYDVLIGKAHYKTTRVPTDSGAIRLEDKAHAIVWLQMSNKSMLLDEKAGKRLANNCRNDLQAATEKALLVKPDTTILGKP